MKQPILVWDLPTRIVHWTLALSFAGTFFTGESERWRDIHVMLGYTVLGLIVFRLAWGFVGTCYVRFAVLIRCSKYVIRHLIQIVRGHAWHPVGHNPTGAVTILLILLLGTVSSVSGWAVYEEIGGDWLETLHEYVSDAMLAVVLVHIAGVVVVSYLQRENLILAMITGRKHGESNQAISSGYPLIAMLLLMSLIGFWIWAWPDSKDAKWLHEVGQEVMELIRLLPIEWQVSLPHK